MGRQVRRAIRSTQLWPPGRLRWIGRPSVRNSSLARFHSVAWAGSGPEIMEPILLERFAGAPLPDSQGGNEPARGMRQRKE